MTAERLGGRGFNINLTLVEKCCLKSEDLDLFFYKRLSADVHPVDRLLVET